MIKKDNLLSIDILRKDADPKSTEEDYEHTGEQNQARTQENISSENPKEENQNAERITTNDTIYDPETEAEKNKLR